MIYHALYRDMMKWFEIVIHLKLIYYLSFLGVGGWVGVGGVYFTLSHIEHILLLAYSNRLKIINL